VSERLLFVALPLLQLPRVSRVTPGPTPKAGRASTSSKSRVRGLAPASAAPSSSASRPKKPRFAIKGTPSGGVGGLSHAEGLRLLLGDAATADGRTDRRASACRPSPSVGGAGVSHMEGLRFLLDEGAATPDRWTDGRAHVLHADPIVEEGADGGDGEVSARGARRDTPADGRIRSLVPPAAGDGPLPLDGFATPAAALARWWQPLAAECEAGLGTATRAQVMRGPIADWGIVHLSVPYRDSSTYP
jgi:hypothetical protein